MKKIVSLILAVLMLLSVVPMAASAYTYVCPDYIHAWRQTGKTPATCTSRAYTSYECMDCGVTMEQAYGSTLPHPDKNHDGRCDVCNEDLTISCGHLCHRGGFFYKIALFFWKLFKTNKECACGMYHY